MRFGLVFVSAIATGLARAIDESDFAVEDIIERDVAILGGGASGTYAAVRLREDLNVSVIVIEPKDHLGGHVDTYFVPGTNTSIEYGVQTYLEYGNSRAFFDRFDVPLKSYPRSTLSPINVDISSGSNLSYVPPNNTFPALAKWLNLTEKYSPYLLPGYWDFPKGSEIPDELLEPFGTIAQRYGIEDAAPLMASISNLGVGGISKVLTLHVMLAFGAPITRELLASSLFVPATGSNSLLYSRALQLLNSDVLLNTHVIAGERTDAGVKLLVHSPARGSKKLIKARKLLFTPPPSLANLSPLCPDAAETAALTTWTPTWSFVGVARIPSLPANISVNYFSPQAAPADYLAIRDWPWTLRLDSRGPAGAGLFRVLFSTDFAVTHDEAKGMVVEGVGALFKEGGSFAGSGSDDDVEFVAFADHNSVLWRQSPEILRQGFVRDLYALQGRRSTWFTGNLWSGDYSGNVWAFTEDLLPRLIRSLGE
ncbi:hypothetical protein MBLNU230_g4238t1 [Neophaeotheca triangularis]